MLEFNPELVSRGQAMSQNTLPMRSTRLCDVLSAESAAPLQQAGAVIALHACGDLHTHLVRQVAV